MLEDSAVIRAGQSVFIFCHDIRPILECPIVPAHEFVGKFYADLMVEAIKEATLSGRHLLLAGPSGSGKELSAKTAAALLGGKPPLKLLAHNAARFSSEEEATATLFGVGAKVFSNVDQRVGLIASADKGMLFLDEIHNLPIRVQRSLLRVIENGEVVPIGERHPVSCQVRFVFASNALPPDFGLAPDLLARLRVVQVPPLSKRIADIPTIFDHLLAKTLVAHGLSTADILSQIKGDHYESLCLDRFKTDNVRGLLDLADRIATSIASGKPKDRAVSSVFNERFDDSPVVKRYRTDITIKRPPSNQDLKNEEGNSRYEKHKDTIIAAFQSCDGNISATQRLLGKRGIRCNRRWLGVFIKKWGVRS